MRRLLTITPLPLAVGVILAQADPGGELVRQAPWYIGGALLVAVAFTRRWIVPGWTYNEQVARADALEAKLDAVNNEFRQLVMPRLTALTETLGTNRGGG